VRTTEGDAAPVMVTARVAGRPPEQRVIAALRDGTAMREAQSALEAARLRFRPILMTAFAFILGVVPLLTASGAGAEARKVMGMTVFSGMLIATIIGVCLIPVLFVAVEKVLAWRSGAAPEQVPPGPAVEPATKDGH
jgi:predicted RND superfamily exporter protein